MESEKAPSTDFFLSEKARCLNKSDLSRKGSVDEPIQDMVRHINSLPNYFTTSSCSGRTVIYSKDTESSYNKNGQSFKPQKKGCIWLYASHTTTTLENLTTVLLGGDQNVGSATIKFEPLILHVRCRTLSDAQKLVWAAISSGFRNSGITFGTSMKYIVAVRSTHGLEVPLSDAGRLLVSAEYLEFLCREIHSRMEENFRRNCRLHQALIAMDREGEEAGKVVEPECRSSGTVNTVIKRSGRTKETEECDERVTGNDDDSVEFGALFG